MLPMSNFIAIFTSLIRCNYLGITTFYTLAMVEDLDNRIKIVTIR
jgi:hypothetical protein